METKPQTAAYTALKPKEQKKEKQSTLINVLSEHSTALLCSRMNSLVPAALSPSNFLQSKPFNTQG